MLFFVYCDANIDIIFELSKFFLILFYIYTLGRKPSSDDHQLLRRHNILHQSVEYETLVAGYDVPLHMVIPRTNL